MASQIAESWNPLIENAIAGKWVEILKEIAPQVRRIGFIQDLCPKSGADGFDTNDSNYLRPMPQWRGG